VGGAKKQRVGKELKKTERLLQGKVARIRELEGEEFNSNIKTEAIEQQKKGFLRRDVIGKGGGDYRKINSIGGGGEGKRSKGRKGDIWGRGAVCVAQ